MNKIKARTLRNISLTDEDYDKYLNHFKTPPFSSLIEKNVCFSNQQEDVHKAIKEIKNDKKYADDFFVAAQKFINEGKILVSSSVDSQSRRGSIVEDSNQNLSTDQELVLSEDALVNYQTSSTVNQSSCYQPPAVFLANQQNSLHSQTTLNNESSNQINKDLDRTPKTPNQQ
ncbi:10366_t:CDS:2 [Dentiscutata heterogama]|uniref:10366_t:CDS:1 n=1 Tax=Dentiscutata heterogama TaxID=1316150 RepID=A0ACA9LCG6_9GLOM|nr:10366_t:CDS:2 [Dentiscutata heterogama]